MVNLSQSPDRPDDAPAPDPAQFEGLIDPFVPLIPGGLDLALPPGFSDAYFWVAYTVLGEYYSEVAADPSRRQWRTIDMTNVAVIDLFPVMVRCDEHAGSFERGCSKCLLSWQRSHLTTHRIQVPPEGAAYFERRRDRELGTDRLAQTWTIIGWERNFLSVRPRGLKLADMGPRDVRIEYYMFLDDLGRTYHTSNLQAL